MIPAVGLAFAFCSVTIQNNDDRFFEPLDTWVVDAGDPLLVADHRWEVEVDQEEEEDDCETQTLDEASRSRLDSESSTSSSSSENDDDFGNAESQRARNLSPSAASSESGPQNDYPPFGLGIAGPKHLSFDRSQDTGARDAASTQELKNGDVTLHVGRVQVRRRKLGQLVGKQTSRIPTSTSATSRVAKNSSKSPSIGTLTSSTSTSSKVASFVHARHWVPARRHWVSGYVRVFDANGSSTCLLCCTDGWSCVCRYLGVRTWDAASSIARTKARSSKSPVVAFAKAKAPLVAYVNGSLSKQAEAAAAAAAAATGGVLRLRMTLSSSVVPMAFRSQHHCLALRNFKELPSGDVDEWIFDIGHAAQQQALERLLLHHMKDKKTPTKCEPAGQLAVENVPTANKTTSPSPPAIGRLDIRRGLAVAKALTRWRTEQDRRAMRARMRKRLVCVSLPSNHKAEVRVLLPIHATLESVLAYLMGNNASRHYHLEMRTELHELGFFPRSNPAPNDEPLSPSTPIVDIPSSRHLYLRYRAAIADRAALALQQEVIMMPKEPFQVRACFRPEQSKETATEKEYFLRQRRLSCKDQMGQVQRDLLEASREDAAFDEEVKALKDQVRFAMHSHRSTPNKLLPLLTIVVLVGFKECVERCVLCAGVEREPRSEASA